MFPIAVVVVVVAVVVVSFFLRTVDFHGLASVFLS